MDGLPDRLARVGMVARWRPLHLGQAAVLDGLCDRAERVTIGIGSSNRYDLRNPFTAAETRQMLTLYLDDRLGSQVEIVDVPDLGDPPRWAAMVAEMFGKLDVYVTANDWVTEFMAPHYPVVHPLHFVPPHRRIPLEGTMVRQALARGGPWWQLVPPVVADFMRREGLDRRFVQEFGDQTLAASE